MTWLLLVALAGAPEKRVLPFQLDVSAVAGLGERSAAGVALYAGAAYGPARPPWGTPFFAAGFEFVQQTRTAVPFRASYGVQLRAGYAWSGDLQGHDSLMPDVMLYARVTPFIGSSTGVGELGYGPGPEGVPGLRLGVGMTVPWWTKTLLFLRPFGQRRGFFGEALNVVATLLLVPLALFNHVEVVGELVPLAGASTVTLRLGCGF